MVAGLVRTFAIVASLILVASFALFARDQVATGSEEQQAAVAEEVSTTHLPARTTPEAQPRRALDGAAHALESPFSALATGSSGWGERLLPTLAALLVFGFGFGALARSDALSGSRRRPASRT